MPIQVYNEEPYSGWTYSQGYVRREISKWVPSKFLTYERWEQLADVIGQMFDELHSDITELREYSIADKIPLAYLERLEAKLGIPEKIRQENEEIRRFFAKRVALLIPLIGTEAVYRLIEKLAAIEVVTVAIWADDNYEIFQPGEIEGGFISSHIFMQFMFDYTGVDYQEVQQNAREYFETFRNIEVVVDYLPTLFARSTSVYAGISSIQGVHIHTDVIDLTPYE